jgi:carbon monoxide dehydrogenase subunit G
MIQCEGDRDFAPPPAVLWGKLSDARFLVACIPGVESVAKSEPGEAVCTIRPGFSFVRGTLDITARVAEAEPEKSVKLLLHSKGIGSSSDVEALLALAPHDGGTRVHWQVQVKELGGLLKLAPQGLIRASAQKVISDAWTAVEAQLARSQTAT